MSVHAGRKAPFELLHFAAAPTGQDVAIIEVEGRFPAARERFTRRPVLVIDDIGDRRLELPAVWSQLDGERWSGIFAAPTETLSGGSFALGVRGMLLELPQPDRSRDEDRLAALAREANQLRRRLEAAEARAEVAEQQAREQADVRVAEAEARATEREEEAERRIATIEAEAAARAQELEAAAAQRAEEAERAATERAEAAEESAALRIREAEERAERAEQALHAAEAGIDVLRGELAEDRERAQGAIAELQARLEDVRGGEAPTDAAPPTEPFRLREAPAPAAPRSDDGDTEDDPTEDDLTTAMPPRRVTPEPVTSAPIHHATPEWARWVAVGALACFALLLVILLLS